MEVEGRMWSVCPVGVVGGLRSVCPVGAEGGLRSVCPAGCSQSDIDTRNACLTFQFHLSLGRTCDNTLLYRPETEVKDIPSEI